MRRCQDSTLTTDHYFITFHDEITKRYFTLTTLFETLYVPISHHYLSLIS